MTLGVVAPDVAALYCFILLDAAVTLRTVVALVRGREKLFVVALDIISSWTAGACIQFEFHPNLSRK